MSWGDVWGTSILVDLIITYHLTQTAKRKSYQYTPCSEVHALSCVNYESQAKEGEEDGIGRI